MQRTHIFIPAVLGAMLLWELVSGRLFLYIGDRTIWLVAASVPVLAAMTLVQLRRPLLKPSAAGFVLLAPVLLAVLSPPRPLASDAVEVSQAPTTPAPGAVALNPTLVRVSPDQNWDLKQLGLMRLNDPRLTGVSGGRATLLGFVYHPSNEAVGPNEFFVARFLVRCCTADAIALSFPVRYSGAADLARDTWVEVQGPLVSATSGSADLPYVDAEQVRFLPQPDRPYLFL